LTTACIVSNTLLMAVVWDGMPGGLSSALDYCNCVRTAPWHRAIVPTLALLRPYCNVDVIALHLG
jgi:hypothetical protein